MNKLFGILFAVLFVFCIAGNASATRFEHGDLGRCLKPKKSMDINWGEIRSPISFTLNTLKKIKSNGSVSCGPISQLFKGCGNLDFNLCRTPPPSCNSVPEPVSMLLFGVGLAGLGVFKRKLKKA